MDYEMIGTLIRSLRKERSLTQKQLAQILGVTEQAVSKWERGLGCPDISLFPDIARVLGVSMEGLLSGQLPSKSQNGGFMQTISFYVCPTCGNLITSSGLAAVTCCGRTLHALSAQKPDETHQMVLEPVEDEWYLSAPHPMEKEHYLAFAALVKTDQVLLLRRWPEWDFQARISRHGHGFLYWYCTKHGLFRQPV